jgi:hypothetical protein
MLVRSLKTCRRSPLRTKLAGNFGLNPIDGAHTYYSTQWCSA